MQKQYIWALLKFRHSTSENHPAPRPLANYDITTILKETTNTDSSINDGTKFTLTLPINEDRDE